jgi:tetratricopeptide (TPR) repeat protein
MKTFTNNNYGLYEHHVKTLFPNYLEKGTEKPKVEDYRLLALLCQDENLNNKSIYYFEKVLDININTLGIKHKKTANAYIDLAEAYVKEGSFNAEALLAYQTALAIQKKLFGVKSIECATVYSALGNLFFSTDEMDKALTAYREALTIRQNELGKLHPLTAKSSHELGYFYASLEEYELALPLFEQSLETRVELFRMSHPETAKSYNSLGICYYHLFEYEKAEHCLVEALKIKALILPKSDERIVRCKKNLKEIRKHLSYSLWNKITNFFNSL